MAVDAVGERPLISVGNRSGDSYEVPVFEPGSACVQDALRDPGVRRPCGRQALRRALLGAWIGVMALPRPGRSDAKSTIVPDETRIVATFPDPASVRAWRPIDDRVMGGQSRSSANWSSSDAALVFSGQLSLEQGGGFASLRAEFDPLDLSGSRGLRLMVRGDGRDYRINLRDRSLAQAADDGTQFRATFRADSRWETRQLPWTDFIATRRGRALPEPRSLRIDALVSLGWMTAFREPGPFRLEVRRIEAY